MDVNKLLNESGNRDLHAMLSNTSSSIPQMHFQSIDYVLFVGMLLLSTIIGIYYGFLAKTKQNTVKEYLLGGKTMHIIPISVSLIASHISGSTLLGVPVEVYTSGTQYWMFVIPAFMVAFSMINIFLPVFYELQLTSCYAYLENRFDKNVKMIASSIYALHAILFMPIVIYVPALALSQVSGIDLYLIATVIFVVCIFYTTIGGLKAVVMTDTLQFFIMMAAILAIFFMGLEAVGGLTNVWEASERGNRLQFFNMDPSPFVRSSFWTVALGLSTLWIANLGVNQSCIQKFLAVPDLQKAKRSVWIFTFGLIFVKSFSCITGLIMYAHYETCDPITTKVVQKNDQVLPHYVVEVAGKIPGISGLFISGIFSAALSTMSASLNTVAGTIYEDFLKSRNPNATEKRASNTMKVIVVLLGLVEMSMVFVVEKLGTVFQVSIAISGITSGALLGLFSFGILVRKANTKGAICGAVSSIVVVSIIAIGSFNTNHTEPVLPMRTDGCDFDFVTARNLTTAPIPQAAEEVFWVFRISVMYFSFIGLLVVFLVGYPVSLLTSDNSTLDERLLTPFLRSKDYKDKERLNKQFEAEYSQIEQKQYEMKNLT